MHSSRPCMRRPPAAPASTCHAARPATTSSSSSAGSSRASQRASAAASASATSSSYSLASGSGTSGASRAGRAQASPMASSATRGARSARIRPSLMQSPAAADRATSWNTTPTPPAAVPSRSRMPPCSSSQRPTVSDSGRTGSPAPIVTPTPNACRPPAASAPYSRSAAPPPTTTIASGRAAASPATARAAAAATLRRSSGGSLAAAPSASGISRGGCGQTAPAISMASVCRSHAHGGHPRGCRMWSGQPPYAAQSAAVCGPVTSRAG